MNRLLPLCLLACQPAASLGPHPPPVTWQINLSSARGMGASFDVGDLDHDGLTDLAFAAPSEYGAQGYGMQVWLGTGGAFSFREAIPSPVNPTQAGTAVAICDLDGDGWSEIAVGEPEGPDCGLGTAPACPTDTRRGRIALYRFDQRGLERTPFTELLGQHPGDQLGLRVICPGDVDHDGYDDLVATAPRAQGVGEGLVLLYRGSATGVAPSPAWSAGQQGRGAAEGEALAVADLNGDGWLDVLTGAPEWDETWTDEGRVALYLNGPTGLSPTPSQEWLGGKTMARFGATLAAGADVNGDGHSELLVGAPSWDAPGVLEAGHARLHLGSPTGPAATPSFSWQGGFPSEQLGAGVAMADQDGDGLAEVLITTGSATRVTSWPGTPAGPDLTRPLRWSGRIAHPRAGSKIADVGDLDGDGLPDLMTGVVGVAKGQAQGIGVIAGHPASWDGDGDGVPEREDCDDTNPAVGVRGVEVVGDEVDGDCDGRELCFSDRDFDGHAGTLRVSTDRDCRDLPETLTLAADDCDDLAPERYPGAPAIPSDGRDQSCATSDDLCFVDADGDGFAASTATVPSGDGDCEDPGEAPDARQIWATALITNPFGRNLSAAGDLDGDGGVDLILEDGADSRYGFRVLRAGLPELWMVEAVNRSNGVGVGDLDGDGLEDIVWMGGIHRQRPATPLSGSLSVLRGDLSGLQPRPWQSLPDWGETPITLALAPDMDGDSYPEVIISRPTAVTEPTGTSKVHVLRGGPAGLERADGWALPELTAVATAPPLAVGDFNGDGLGDLFTPLHQARPAHAEMWLYLGSPTGPQLAPGWPAASPDLALPSRPLTVADFNADGFDDLIFVTACQTNVSCLNVFHGGPIGLPSTPDLRVTFTSLPGGTLARAMASGDLDGDDFPDLALATWNVGTDEIVTLFGSARGLLPSTATRGLESLDAFALEPAGPAPLGAAVWSVGEGYEGQYAARIDVRWLAPDCDDGDVNVHAAAWDAPGDGVDADCDGYDTCWLDADGDCLRDPTGRVTPDVSGRCDGPREAPVGAAVDPDDRRATPITPAAGLAVGRPACAVVRP
jgi:hypothetical protein